MDEEQRLDRAVQRIGTAIDRLEAAITARPALAVDNPAADNPSESALIARHSAMQDEVRQTLVVLDDLISGLEK